MNKIYYFFMKVGYNNCFLENFKEIGGLWVGFQGRPTILKYRNNLSHNIDLKNSDYDFLCLFSSKQWRKRVRIVTFSKELLTVWKITGDLQYINEVMDPLSPAGMLLQNRHVYKKFPRYITRKINNDREFKLFLKKSKRVPVKKEYEIERSQLIAPIDSLSVYQYLNRGTFRPIFRIGGKTELPDFICDSRMIGSLPPVKIRQNQSGKIKELEETAFGKFVRVYLSGRMSKNLSAKTTRRYKGVLAEISLSQAIHLLVSILNPIQIETLAFLFVLDVGLIPDVGLGKGLDVVDVRGSCRYLRRQDASNAIKKVIRILKVLKVHLTDEFINKLYSELTLNIQCTAGFYKDMRGTKGVLLLRRKGRYNGTKNTIAVDDLLLCAKKMKFNRVLEWLKLAIFDLTGRRLKTIEAYRLNSNHPLNERA